RTKSLPWRCICGVAVVLQLGARQPVRQRIAMYRDPAVALADGHGGVMRFPVFCNVGGYLVDYPTQLICVLPPELKQFEADTDCSRLGALFDLLNDAANGRTLQVRQYPRRILFPVNSVAPGCHRDVYIGRKLVI